MFWKSISVTVQNFNMVDYVFTETGCKDLDKTNALNHEFYNYASAMKGGMYDNEFITSHTDFTREDYGESPFAFVKSLGFTEADWDKSGKVTILRASCMSPYAYDLDTFNEYAEKIDCAIGNKLDKIYTEWDKEN